MGQSERTLTELGQRVATLQDRAPEAARDHLRGRTRLLGAQIQRPSPARFSLPRWGETPHLPRLGALLAAAALLVATWVVVRPRQAMRFELGATEPGMVGAWIAAPPASELPIRFTDGSVLRLAPGGRARVASVTDAGAEVALERGALDLAVVHRRGARWLVRVGPFQVNVIGTRFDASWDPVAERFTVALREGAITVTGPVVGDARPVRAGERLTVSPATSTLEVGPLGAAAPATDEPPATGAQAPADPSATQAPGAPAPDPSATSPPAATSVPATPSAPARVEPPAPRATAKPAEEAAAEAPGWRSLALDAKYKEALAAAEREGFDAIVGAAGARDLHALGDAARLGGSIARATQAFTALRARFPGSAEAASAAFILGRIAQDQRKDHAGAAAWLSRYLSEQPGGAYAADAAGRLVEAADRMGDEAGARRAAERYLAAYPGGPHAAYAKSVLARHANPATP